MGMTQQGAQVASHAVPAFDPAGLPGFNSPGEAAMFELQAVQAAVAAAPAAHSLALCCLQCFTLLLGCSKELPLQQLQAVLSALALQPVQPAATQAPNSGQVSKCLSGLLAGTKQQWGRMSAMNSLPSLLGPTAPSSTQHMLAAAGGSLLVYLKQPWW
jgi:hypothetical protein